MKKNLNFGAYILVHRIYFLFYKGRRPWKLNQNDWGGKEITLCNVLNSISGESHWEMDRKSKGKAVLTESDTGFNYSPAGLSILVVDHDQKSLQEVVTNLRKCKHQYKGLFWSPFWLSFLFDGVLIDTSHICERCFSLKNSKGFFDDFLILHWWPQPSLYLLHVAASVMSHLSLSALSKWERRTFLDADDDLL